MRIQDSLTRSDRPPPRFRIRLDEVTVAGRWLCIRGSLLADSMSHGAARQPVADAVDARGLLLEA